MYFFLPKEPPGWVGLAALALIFGLLFRKKTWKNSGFPALLMGGAVVLGLVAAQVRSWSVDAPVLHRDMGPLMLSSTVDSLLQNGGRWQAILSRLDIDHASLERFPIRVRISLSDIGDVRPGDRVRMLVKLRPPPTPVIPGGYDFARRAWFEGIGAVGFALGAPTVLQAAPLTSWARFLAWTETVRLSVATRLQQTIGGSEGAVAAALVTGQKGRIPDAVIKAYRESGLAHLLAISGLHMALVAGLVFLGLRKLIALWPYLALRVDGKKIAAVGGLFGASAYLMISGGSVPTQRAYVMVCLAFLAMVINRSALSLRTLAVAAAGILIIRPEALVGASFQMSFAAVTLLIGVYEQVSPCLARWRRSVTASGYWGSLISGLGVYGAGIVVSTLVATVATAPFAAYHFHSIALYGLAANLVVIPVMTLWVMPLLMASCFLMPFGADALLAVPLRAGLHLVEFTAREISSWPMATVHVAPFSVGLLVVLSISALWILIWKQSWRWAGLVGLVIAAFIPWSQTPPDVLVSADGRLIAVWDGQGMVLSPGRKDRFTRDVWIEWWGASDAPKVHTLEDLSGETRLRCDAMGCTATIGREASLLWTDHPAAMKTGCRQAQILVTPAWSVKKGLCPPDVAMITAATGRQSGAQALWVESDGSLDSQTVAGERGDRPWTRR